MAEAFISSVVLLMHVSSDVAEPLYSVSYLFEVIGMSQAPKSTDERPAFAGNRLLRGVLVAGLLCGAVFLGLMYFPVYRVPHELDSTGGAIDFLRKSIGISKRLWQV